MWKAASPCPLTTLKSLPQAMRATDIEAWAIDVADRIARGAGVEDSRVELKAEWIPPDKAARRIAAHANSAAGEVILWLIGLDEENGIVGAERRDLSTWWPQVQANFDGVSPEVIDVIVPYQGGTLQALLMSTERAPFVVKNPVNGQPGAGPVTLEVPWREGTRVRSARREDLLRVLVPKSRLPRIEVLDVRLLGLGEFNRVESRYNAQSDKEYSWRFFINMYLVPFENNRVILPFHHTDVLVEAEPALPSTEFPRVRMTTDGESLRSGPGSPEVTATAHELIATGPGRVTLEADYTQQARDADFGDMARVRVHLRPIDAACAITIVSRLTREEAEERPTYTHQASDLSVA